jgi:hypothetical protein
MTDQYKADYTDPKSGKNYYCVARLENGEWFAELHKSGGEMQTHGASSLEDAKEESGRMLVQKLKDDKLEPLAVLKPDWREFPFG